MFVVIINVLENMPFFFQHNFKNKGFLTFETITLVPIQNKMIDASLLTQAEVSNLLSNVSECIRYEHFCNANIYR